MNRFERNTSEISLKSKRHDMVERMPVCNTYTNSLTQFNRRDFSIIPLLNQIQRTVVISLIFFFYAMKSVYSELIINLFIVYDKTYHHQDVDVKCLYQTCRGYNENLDDFDLTVTRVKLSWVRVNAAQSSQKIIHS